MENRLPIELASDYNLYKQAVTDFYIKIENCLLFKNGDRINKDVFFEKYRDYFMGAVYNMQIEKGKENVKDMISDLYIFFKTKMTKDSFDDEGHAKRVVVKFLPFILKRNNTMIYKDGDINTLTEEPLEEEIDESNISMRINVIKDQISTLPNDLKQIITLRYLEGLSLSEIAKKLNISRGYVCKMSGKAINLIKNNLGIEIEIPPNLLKSVIQYNLDGQLIKEYPSLYKAAQKTNINVGSIGQCCYGHREKAGGYKWDFIRKK